MNALKKHVLVIDNDESMRFTLQNKLFQAGYNVTVAGGGAHAQQIFQTGKPFDLVICELRMPIKDGVDVVKYMRANQLTMPIIMLSNAPDRDKIIAAAKLGVVDILVKPVKPTALVDLIKAKLGDSGESESAAA